MLDALSATNKGHYNNLVKVFPFAINIHLKIDIYNKSYEQLCTILQNKNAALLSAAFQLNIH